MPPIPLLPILLLLAGAAAAGAAAEPPAPAPTSPAPPPAKNKTIYELLPLFGLPAGLFPANVTAFSLADNGSLAVDLAGPCYVHFEYLTYFEPRVTGVLRYGSLTELEGVQVRRFLVWFSVVRVKVDLPPPPRFVYLDIGWITRKLPAADFQSVHACEAGKRRGCRPVAEPAIYSSPGPQACYSIATVSNSAHAATVNKGFERHDPGPGPPGLGCRSAPGAASPPRSPPPPLGSRTSLPNFRGCRRSNFVASSHELTAFRALKELKHHTPIC